MREVERNETEYDPDTVGKFSHYTYVENVQFLNRTYDIYAPQFDDIDDGAEAYYLANTSSVDNYAHSFILHKNAVHISQDSSGVNAVCFLSYYYQARTMKKIGTVTVSTEVRDGE